MPTTWKCAGCGANFADVPPAYETQHLFSRDCGLSCGLHSCLCPGCHRTLKIPEFAAALHADHLRQHAERNEAVNPIKAAPAHPAASMEDPGGGFAPLTAPEDKFLVQVVVRESAMPTAGGQLPLPTVDRRKLVEDLISAAKQHSVMSTAKFKTALDEAKRLVLAELGIVEPASR